MKKFALWLAVALPTLSMFLAFFSFYRDLTGCHWELWIRHKTGKKRWVPVSYCWKDGSGSPALLRYGPFACHGPAGPPRRPYTALSD